jgi:flagellar assembly protein FliH
MSSRLLPPESEQLASQIPWKQVHTRQRAEAGPPPDQQAIFEQKLRQAELACEQKVLEAHAAGVLQGEAAANEKSSAEIRAVLDRAAQSLNEIAALRPRLRREAEADLVKLALAIARRVIYRELAIDPDSMRGVVMAALDKLQGQELSRVRVHPDFASVLAEALRKLGQPKPVEVLPDPSRERGSLVFETGRGNLDASVETQLDEIERGLTDRLRRIG